MLVVRGDRVFEVTVRHNVVESIRRVTRTPDMQVPDSRLAVSAELARNHQMTGCVDGCYRFDDAERARSFALLALDFVKRVIERHSERIERLDSDAEYAPHDASAPQ